LQPTTAGEILEAPRLNAVVGRQPKAVALRPALERHLRLRVDEIRVFYDVTANTLEILAIIEKREAQAWLTESGTPGPNRGTGEGEG
jgi:mRNA-degrading endonuclease RelE of RelBE toxin-antitoxin system